MQVGGHVWVCVHVSVTIQSHPISSPVNPHFIVTVWMTFSRFNKTVNSSPLSKAYHQSHCGQQWDWASLTLFSFPKWLSYDPDDAAVQIELSNKYKYDWEQNKLWLMSSKNLKLKVCYKTSRSVKGSLAPYLFVLNTQLLLSLSAHTYL